jgi:DNA-binding winged helix-turn-helix (wHTH) protein
VEQPVRVYWNSSGLIWDSFGEAALRVRFADCTLDRDTREVSRAGKLVHLEPKAYRLLELLLAARPKALSKDELQDALWPNTFVSERSLARLAGVLRDRLGDRAQKPRLIRTLHGFGYAFCGEVTEVERDGSGRQGSDFQCRIAWGDREVALGEGENLVGRDPAGAVFIDLASVSRRHARIVVSDGVATIEDLGSRNGTCARGERISKRTRLENGDKIKIGAASLTFRSFGRLGTTQSEVAE